MTDGDSVMAEHNQVWNDCLSYLSRRVNRQSFYTWLKPTVMLGVDDSTMQIGVPNRFVADWLQEHYSDLITEALRSVTERDCSFAFIVSPHCEAAQTDMFVVRQHFAATAAAKTAEPWNGNGCKMCNELSDRYHFENFVVGDSNEFAYAASIAVGKSPGKTRYNPLFIYGGVGLGKTHLAQAIGNYVIDNDKAARVLYATSEKFTTDFINSISNKSIADFSNRYRSADMLLIDDIQFFTGKESTQEQFFHTFNTLHQNGRQIVLTADRPPRDIKGLEERLLSRFSSGLVTDIQPPSLETRIAILQRKAESDNVKVSADVLSYIAGSVSTNIRDLEGCLTRLLAYASLRGKEVTVDIAQHLLRDSIPSVKETVSIEQIQRRVAESYNISPEMMQAKRKTAEVALARQIAMYLCRTLTSSSLKGIGAAFGGRDHSTVIHAHKTILEMIRKDVNLKLRIDQITNSLYV